MSGNRPLGSPGSLHGVLLAFFHGAPIYVPPVPAGAAAHARRLRVACTSHARQLLGLPTRHTMAYLFYGSRISDPPVLAGAAAAACRIRVAYASHAHHIRVSSLVKTQGVQRNNVKRHAYTHIETYTYTCIHIHVSICLYTYVDVHM